MGFGGVAPAIDVAGRENYCASRGGPVGGGLGYDSGLAENMRVPDERFLLALKDLDPVVAAPLTDAGLTSYHAISRSQERLSAGSIVVVIGVGGVVTSRFKSFERSRRQPSLPSTPSTPHSNSRRAAVPTRSRQMSLTRVR